MPKRKKGETSAEQSERFKKLAQDMIDAGELSPTEDGVDRVMKGVARLRADWFAGGDQEYPPSEPDQPDD